MREAFSMLGFQWSYRRTELEGFLSEFQTAIWVQIKVKVNELASFSNQIHENLVGTQRWI